ncbi:MAG: DUF4445 domain-containing protein [Clostridia bacterium]|nr:DUF4445 domain-containing protein [Clostridia bacterium]
MATVTLFEAGLSTEIRADAGETLLEALLRAGKGPATAVCGGHHTCGRCKALCRGELSELSAEELELLTEQEQLQGIRLLCCARARGNAQVYALGGETMQVQTASLQSRYETDGEGGFGFAADVGTTTVAVFLMDLQSGEVLGVRSAPNAQRAFGADVISRCDYASRENGLALLQQTLLDQLASLVRELCEEHGVAFAALKRGALAGNTVMEHLAAGEDPASIAVAPYTPKSLFGEYRILPGLPCSVWMAPCVAGYVGGDVTVGFNACVDPRGQESLLFADVGTNGELVLAHRGRLYTCATAAGPAFEGAHISCGMSGSAGAVDRVWVQEGRLAYSVIGKGEPKGLCGSGILDLAAALLETEQMDESGALESDEGLMWLDRQAQLSFTQRDVRELQLAKGAVAAGIDVLLKQADLAESGLSRLLLAGGFGTYLNPESACRIGLLPSVGTHKITAVGNAAGLGACDCLKSGRAREDAVHLAAQMQYIELSCLPAFNEAYMERMLF